MILLSRAPVILVVAGPSGAGKSTLAAALAARTGWAFVEGDDLHPAANVAKMASRRPLSDADRLPWLAAVASCVGSYEATGTSAIITCSALRRPYRDVLRAGHPSLRFVWLEPPVDVLAARVHDRPGHFMPASLLGSQLAAAETLEPDEPGLRLDSSAPLEDLVAAVLSATAT